MAPPPVVPAFDVAEEGHARFGLALEGTAIEQLALEAGKEALRHGVVVGVADAAHRRTHAELGAALTERNTRVLGGFNSSSQHVLIGGCDGCKEAAGGSARACEDEVARAASGFASITATALLAGDRRWLLE